MDFNSFIYGQSIGKYAKDGFPLMSKVDIHSEPGSVQAQYALEADATSGVQNEACVQAISPTGTIYYFSTTSGKIWKRTAGTYSSITANTNGEHRGAQYYNGKIYFWTADYLGVFTVETEASRNNSFGTFSNGDARGSCEENLTLYICDGKYVASVNSSGTFAANALDIPAQFIGTCIIPDGYTNILIGTMIYSTVHECRAFVWDTYSDSFTLSDLIPERGINTFINCDDVILAQCGVSGHLYQWTGGTMTLFDNELRNETTGVGIGHQYSATLNGRPLIVAGSNIYSIYRRYSTMPRALVLEYTATDLIKSIIASGDFLSVSIAGGVNKISSTRATGTINTPQLNGSADNVIVDYTAGGDGIGIATQVNGAGSYTSRTVIQDTVNNQVYFDGGLGQVNFIQAQITLTGSAVINNIKII